MNTKQSVAQLAVPHRKRLSSTMVVALLLCVVAGAVMINAADFPATAIETDPGASAFPTFYACALIVLAVLLVIRDLLQAKPANSSGREGGYRQSVTALANTTPHRINHFALIRIRGFYRHDPRCGGGYCSFCCL